MDDLANYGTQLNGLLSAATIQVDGLASLLREIASKVDLEDRANRAQFIPGLGYSRLPLLRVGETELTLVVLQPGQTTGAHDHGKYQTDQCVGMVLVVAGTELNRIYEIGGDNVPHETSQQELDQGMVFPIAASLIHSVEAVGPVRAISLHAYRHAQGDPATGKRRFKVGES